MDIKVDNYKKILSEIAEERGLFELATYIRAFNSPMKELSEEVGANVYPYKVPIQDNVMSTTALSNAEKVEAIRNKYKITQMPEATCDGCQ